jgi:ribulose-5-phosphate 4-epimerase/fuculose-1-phosphate aldolase
MSKEIVAWQSKQNKPTTEKGGSTMAAKNSSTQAVAQLADDVLFGARVLYRELDDIFGHVSGRLPREAKREGLLFARMRIAPKPLDPDEVMEIDFSCRRIKGKQHVSGETFIHTEIYKGRPDVGAVVHAHPFHVVLLSATGRKLETFNPSSISFRGGVPVLGSQLIYKLEDGREIAETLGNGKAVILKNHGAVTIGRTVAEAVVTMYQLERAAYAHVAAGNDLKAWEPDETYLRVSDQSYKFLWRTWHWELESGGAMARWARKARK